MADTKDDADARTFESAAFNFAALTKSMLTLSSDVRDMAADTTSVAEHLWGKLQGARTTEEAAHIQAEMLQESFGKYAEYMRYVGELMTSLPGEIAGHMRAAPRRSTAAEPAATASDDAPGASRSAG